MASTDPREWLFQGWIGLRIPALLEYPGFQALAAALSKRFKTISSVVYDEIQRQVTFEGLGAGQQRLNIILRNAGAIGVSFTVRAMARAEDLTEFNTPVVATLLDHSCLSEFNMWQLRQSIIIPIRQATEAGKQFFAMVGKHDLYREFAGEAEPNVIGVDQEFAFSAENPDYIQMVLRFQTAGPSTTWLAPDELGITLSAMIEPGTTTLDNLTERWQNAEALLLDSLTGRTGKAISSLIGRLT